ncbi:MAG: heat-inducible transcriptional repressor HrcA [Chlamydiia bacterium]|nr:heat-inducible transcriptional repressor HrcA [Chlamydiia bacterium]
MKEKTKKKGRERRVLMGLVKLYIETGKPIGSLTLQEEEFNDLSPATIRNYFVLLEEKGFLKQQHASSGRIPTAAAFRLYATEMMESDEKDPKFEEAFASFRQFESKELNSYLHDVIDLFSEQTGYAAFLSTVRFDHDLIVDIKLVMIDQKRLFCVLITDFGQIYTELLISEKKLSTFALKRLQEYFLFRLKGKKGIPLPRDEQFLASKLYNEMMVRYLVRYSNFSDEEIIRTGFSRLLSHSEFSDPLALTSSLSLLENLSHMRLLLGDSAKSSGLRFWIGNDLAPYGISTSECAVVAIPYRINQMIVGSIGILGPARMPYKEIFIKIRKFSGLLTETLTTTLYKHKLTFRQPRMGTAYLTQGEKNQLLIEIKE